LEATYFDRPEIFPMGCVGSIEKEIRHPDGKYNFTLVGLRRFRILREVDGKLYRCAEIDLLEEQKHITRLGGTMRLGSYPIKLIHNTLVYRLYGGREIVYERHRHRYEANPLYRKELEEAGMEVTGESHGLIEAVEVRDHPWFLGVQFHPEFTSRLQHPNPAILSFVRASAEQKEG